MDAGTKKLIKTFFIIVVVMVLVFGGLMLYMSMSGKKVGNDELLLMMENAAKNYYAKNSSLLPGKTGEFATVDVETLIKEGYMNSFDKTTSNTSCTGQVTVKNNGGIYLYTPDLKCSEYKVTSIANKIKSLVVTSGDGVYKDGEKYYYAGEYVNNYIKLGEKLFRIVSVDEQNYIKVIDTEITSNEYQWDNRYSHETGSYAGKNDFEKSRLKEFYDMKYTDYSDNVRKYIEIYNWCIEKRNTSDYSVHRTRCSENVNSYLGFIDTFEYAKASLDEACSDIRGGSCNNYNYLADAFPRTIWTSVVAEDNTYQAYRFSYGFNNQDCSSTFSLAFAFHISGNNSYISGEGTKDSPYVIR